MQPALANAPGSRLRSHTRSGTLLQEYLAALAARGAGNSSYEKAARAFLQRWPYPQGWANQPLRLRLSANAPTRVLLNYLMLSGQLRPGYDYLLQRKLSSLLREAPGGSFGPDLESFLAGAAELGYRRQNALSMASQVLLRVLIQTGKAMKELTAEDLGEFAAAVGAREKSEGRPLRHYRTALFATSTVLYHLGAGVDPVEKRNKYLRWDWPHHFTGVNDTIAASMVSYLECAAATRKRTTVLHIAGRLAQFARFLTETDPALSSLAGLERQRHIEPYLAAVAAARNPRSGATLSASERRSRILTVGRMIDDIIEWGWAEAPSRRLIFSGDIPRLPRALPRYLPPDADRRLAEALQASPNRLRADALLLLRATGLFSGGRPTWSV